MRYSIPVTDVDFCDSLEVEEKDVGKAMEWAEECTDYKHRIHDAIISNDINSVKYAIKTYKAHVEKIWDFVNHGAKIISLSSYSKT